MSEPNKKALSKALELLSKRSYSKAILIEKLQLKEFEDEEIKKAIKRLEEFGFLDDLKYAQNLAREYSGFRKCGRQKIKIKLIQKKIPRETIDQALSEIDLQEESENLDELTAKYLEKSKNVPKEKIYNRTLSFLIRKGYSYEQAKSVLLEKLKEG